MSALPLNLEELARSIPARYLERGESYVEQGRVRDFRRSESNRLQAHVQGSRPHPYVVDVRLVPGKAGTQVYGLCSCPMHLNCKHVAAVLLHALRNGSVTEFARAVPPRHAGPAGASRAAVGAEQRLPFELKLWLDRTQRATDADLKREQYAPDVAQRLLYTLRLQSPPRAPQVQLVLARRRKTGGYGSASPWSNARTALQRPPSFVLREDQRILRWLLVEAPGPHPHSFLLTGESAPHILRAMLATGRCHLAEHDIPLREGQPRAGRLHWQLLGDGQQQIACDTDPPSHGLLPMAPPWYVDVERMECGPVETGLEPALAEAVAAAPAVAPEHAAEIRDALTKGFAGAKLPLPALLRETRVQGEPPVPSLRLMSLQAFGRAYRPLGHFLDLAVLSFDYSGMRVPQQGPRTIRAFHDGSLLRIEREIRTEQRFRDTLASLGLVELSEVTDDYPRQHGRDYTLRDPSAWPEFMLRALPRLREQGWLVELDESFRFKVVHDARWFAEVQESGRDWFDLSLGVDVHGQRIDMLPVLVAALRSHPDLFDARDRAPTADSGPLYVRLEDNGLLPLPLARLRPMLSILHELLDAQVAHKVHLRRLDALRLADLERETNLEWTGGTELRAFGKRLAAFTGIQAVASPHGLRAELRPYQREGLAWLQFLREYDLGGILADDMGLGKTVQALAHILVEKEAGRLDRPALVVAPTSVVPNWKAEAARFAPGLRVHVSHGVKRKERFDQFAQFDLVLTTYALLARDRESLAEQQFHLIVLDEAQQIKNARTQAARVVGQLHARHRLCLTGTPLENHLGELWSLFQFVLPGFLGDADSFRRLYRTPVEKRGDEMRRASLARRIRPFLLRRTKEQVAADLPAKTEIVRSVELAGAQRDLYETVRVSMHERVRAEIAARGLAQSQIVVLDALLKLRQICCDPRLLKLDAARKVTESAKLEALLDMLQQLLREGRRVLLFSQFTSMLELIEQELKQLGIGYVKLTGETRDRSKPVHSFQSGKVPLFLISLKAGGTGLNLTAADTVIHYDPWWNPAVERQATDRAHRIGQDKPVFVYKLIASGSVEEKIAQLQESKAALAAGVLGEGGVAGAALTSEDIAALFEPMR